MFHSRQHETVWTNVAPFQNSTACKRFAATAPSPRWCSCLWLSPHVAHGVRRVFARAFVSVICFGFAHDRVWTTTQRFYSFCLGKLVSRSLRKYPDLEQHLATCFVRLEFVFDPSLSLSLFAFAGQREVWWAVCRTGLQIRLQMPPRERQQGESVHLIGLMMAVLKVQTICKQPNGSILLWMLQVSSRHCGFDLTVAVITPKQVATHGEQMGWLIIDNHF